MARRDRIDLRVRDDEKDFWVKAADLRAIELSELIRRAVPFYIAKHPPKSVQGAK